jgi:hypothetical protein
MDSVTLTFTLEQLRVIDQAIQNMPYHLAAPIISSINAQLAEQRMQEQLNGNSLQG